MQMNKPKVLKQLRATPPAVSDRVDKVDAIPVVRNEREGPSFHAFPYGDDFLLSIHPADIESARSLPRK